MRGCSDSFQASFWAFVHCNINRATRPPWPKKSAAITGTWSVERIGRDGTNSGDFQPSTDMACGIGNKNKHMESASDKIYYVNLDYQIQRKLSKAKGNPGLMLPEKPLDCRNWWRGRGVLGA